MELPGYMRQVVQHVLTAVAKAIPVAIQPHIEERMHLGRRPGRKNTTDKLYVNTGRLRRALYPGKPGNVFVVRETGAGVEVEYGIDLGVVRYARIHELGGVIRRGVHEIIMPARPYLRPAAEGFLKETVPKLVAAELQRLWK